MAESEASDNEDSATIIRKQSVFDEAEVKLNSVWATLRDKATEDDVFYALSESDLYNGEKLARRSEILSWYLYDWANSPMWNVVGGLIIPLYLSALALQYGCQNETKYGCDINGDPIGDTFDLKIFMGSWALKPTAFVQVMIGLSGAIQAVTYIGIGALADYSYYQYYGFQICTLIASTMLIVFLFLSSPAHYLFAGWWFAIQLCFFGLALIFYNAYLPLIAESHWIVRRAIRNKKSTDDICKIKQQITDDMSQYGIGCGYFGSLCMTLVAVIVFAFTEDTVYQELMHFGSNTGTTYHEEWLKPVHAVYMRFDETNLVQIQLAYDGIDIDGSIYGTHNNTNQLQIYNTEPKDHITSIHFWINDDNCIHSMRFNTKYGAVSPIYGNANVDNPDQTASTETDDFVFAGYNVYIGDNKVNGMDIIMLNQETGQFPSTFGSRFIIFLVFIWWNIFQLATFKYMQRRDGPPLPSNSNPFTFSAKQTYYAIKSASTYPHMFRYLISWFCFSDGLNTLSVTAVLFATTELDFSSTEAAVLFLEALFLGSWGGILFLWLQRKIMWDSKQMLLLHIIIFLCLCLYSMIGLIPHVPFGLLSKTELFIYVFVYGLNWGSIQSYARSVFAYLVPIGKESQMFSLYEITDKGSSWIGPIMVAIITNHATIRWGLFYVTTFFAVPIPILIWGVNLKIGMKQAGRWIDPDDPNTAVIDRNDGRIEMANDTDTDSKPTFKIKVTSLDDDENEEKLKTKLKDESVGDEMISEPQNENANDVHV